jgi:hypothetical protein
MQLVTRMADSNLYLNHSSLGQACLFLSRGEGKCVFATSSSEEDFLGGRQEVLPSFSPLCFVKYPEKSKRIMKMSFVHIKCCKTVNLVPFPNQVLMTMIVYMVKIKMVGIMMIPTNKTINNFMIFNNGIGNNSLW